MAPRRSPSALLSKYLAQYRSRPHSRVFAPLAEAYRKLGMTEEALKVLREGIKRNPGYPLGYLVLAQCYADQSQWERVAQTLRPLVAQHKDNQALQRLYAQACQETGDLQLALESYKWLLFLNPMDKGLAQKVTALERDVHASHGVVPREAVVRAPEPAPGGFGADDDDWAMMDFAPDSPPAPVDEWRMEPPPAAPRPEDWQVMSRALDDEFFSDEEVTPEDAEAPAPPEARPLVSHTLVDLYLAQDHLGPALELLEKFVELDPGDERSRARLGELRARMASGKPPVNEAEGHNALLRLVEDTVQTPSLQKLEKAYRLFLQQLQLTADERRAGHV